MNAILESDARQYAARIAGWKYASYAIPPDMWARSKYHCAKRVWPIRDQQCGQNDAQGRPLSWRMRFYDMFREPLPQYVGRCNVALRDAGERP